MFNKNWKSGDCDIQEFGKIYTVYGKLTICLQLWWCSLTKIFYHIINLSRILFMTLNILLSAKIEHSYIFKQSIKPNLTRDQNLHPDYVYINFKH